MHVIVNPTGKSRYSGSQILEMSGLLLHWAKTGDEAGLGFKHTFERTYQFGLHEVTGGKVDDEGVYTYPEDPSLFPVIKITRATGEACYIYDYGIVAIIEADGTQFITRMD